MRNGVYHYKESGLDNVILVGGFEYIDSPGGKTIVIHDIDGLQRVIGKALVGKRQRLTGKEFRFLRSELLLSQSNLASMLGVKELTVGRWERGESEIPLSAEAAVRMMYAQMTEGEHGPRMTELLKQIDDLDDELDRMLKLNKGKGNKGKWRVIPDAKAA